MDKRYVEIFDESDLDEIIEQIYARCVNGNCDECTMKPDIEYKTEENDLCYTDIIFELHRRLKNQITENKKLRSQLEQFMDDGR